MTDKELIRRALLGSREAQKECTEKKDCVAVSVLRKQEYTHK